MPTDPDTSPTADHDEDDADGCLCGVEHLDEDATSDEELPHASGGVEANDQEQPGDDEDDIDGCEIDFTDDDQTTDEELPVTVGGV